MHNGQQRTHTGATSDNLREVEDSICIGCNIKFARGRFAFTKARWVANCVQIIFEAIRRIGFTTHPAFDSCIHAVTRSVEEQWIEDIAVRTRTAHNSQIAIVENRIVIDFHTLSAGNRYSVAGIIGDGVVRDGYIYAAHRAHAIHEIPRSREGRRRNPEDITINRRVVGSIQYHAIPTIAADVVPGDGGII